jgi:hypothetical protein
MSPIDDVDRYLESCHTTFADRPETHRIALYASLADRERHTAVHLYRLAGACLDGGSVALWTRGVRLAFTYPHDTRRALFERREARIRLGEWAGWQDLAFREDDPDFQKDNLSCPPGGYTWWDGTEDLSGKSLRIIDVGGYGDSIMWLRFVESLHDRVAGRIYWDVDPVLTECLQNNISHLPRIELIPWTEPGDFDRYLSATSLPSVLGMLPSFSRWTAHRMALPPTRNGAARIGLAWACSTTGVDHLERSIPLGVLAPFFWRDDLEMYSLQVGERAPDAYCYPNVRRPEPPLQSFNDTARWMVSLDGIIAIDTSVAHLAGILGVPTLLLLRFACDRRWGLDDTTPWYPSVRLIRQRDPGDWLSVRPPVEEALNMRWWEQSAGVRVV